METAPVARAAEPDWYAAMARPWATIHATLAALDVPLVIAGDIFDHWKPSPRLIRFAMEMFGSCTPYAIPGQHDLPEHRYEERYRSGYGVLEQAGAITTLPPLSCTRVYPDRLLVTGGRPPVDLWAYPWGYPVQPCPHRDAAALQVAVAHSFIWRQGHGYPGAPMDRALGGYRAQLVGYDLAVFGDNHSGFYARSRDPAVADVLNCGGLMPRRTDERAYQPHMGVLYTDGTVELVPLPVGEDRWSEAAEAATPAPFGAQTGKFIEKLVALSGDSLDFRVLVDRVLDTASIAEDTRGMVRAALDTHGGSAGDGRSSGQQGTASG